jgi:hypothetical protein
MTTTNRGASMFNLHEVIGWFNCANLMCRQPLRIDHITMTTTTHMYRFCCVDCIAEGQEAWDNFLYLVFNRYPDSILTDGGDHLRDELPEYVKSLAAAQAKQAPKPTLVGP